MRNFVQAGKSIFILGIFCGSLLLLGQPASAGSLLEGWSGDVFAGYNQSKGNTQKASGSLSAQAVKKFENSEFSLKGNVFYSESNKSMDGQKWDFLAKFSHDFGKEKKWYNFYQVLVDHDYFGDIDYRVTPATGLGYHISRTEDWTWDVDAGIGYRITRARVNKAADDETVTALAHTFMKKRVFEKSYLSEDMTVYPGLKSGAGFLVRSESVFSNPLSEKMSLELKYIIDYNSEPPLNKKKTDTQLVAGLKYSF